MAQEIKEEKKSIWQRFKEFPQLIHSVKELAVFQVFKSVGVPKGTEIDTLTHLNPDTPVFMAVLVAYEERLNELHGECAAIGRPLYPRFTFFSELFEYYKRLTPSVHGKRAEQVLGSISASQGLKSPDNQQRPVTIGDTGKLEPAKTNKEY